MRVNDRAYIVRFGKTSPEVEIIEAPLREGKEAFLTILKLSHILKEIKEWQEVGTNEI